METLNLDDTFALIKIVDVLESERYDETERIRIALMFLEDFVARRGFNENPVDDYYEGVI